MPHILVVDDDVSFRFFLKSLFTLQGFTVSTARNGHEGETLLEQKLPDLVTLDVMMPEESGLPASASVSAHSCATKRNARVSARTCKRSGHSAVARFATRSAHDAMEVLPWDGLAPAETPVVSG